MMRIVKASDSATLMKPFHYKRNKSVKKIISFINITLRVPCPFEKTKMASASASCKILVFIFTWAG